MEAEQKLNLSDGSACADKEINLVASFEITGTHANRKRVFITEHIAVDSDLHANSIKTV